MLGDNIPEFRGWGDLKKKQQKKNQTKTHSTKARRSPAPEKPLERAEQSAVAGLGCSGSAQSWGSAGCRCGVGVSGVLECSSASQLLWGD